MTDFFYGLDMWVILLAVMLLVGGATYAGHWLGERVKQGGSESADIGTLAAGALGLLALLIAFSFSIAVATYDTRRAMVVEEAVAIDAVADNALMLPRPQQRAVLGLLQDYAATRLGVGAIYDPAQIARDETRTLVLRGLLWNQAVTVSADAPTSLAVRGFVSSLETMNGVGEKRLAARHYHIPFAVIALLVGSAMVAMGFTGFHTGIAGERRIGAGLIMVATLAISIMLIADLDRPARGMFKMPREALREAVDHVSAVASASAAAAPVEKP